MRKNAVFFKKILLPRTRTLLLFALPAAVFLLPLPLFDHLFWRITAFSLALYVLLSLLLRLPQLWHSGRAALRRHAHPKREWWARAALYGGILFNLLYALLRLLAGALTGSLWFCAEAVYYVILGSIRFSLTEQERRIASETNTVRQEVLKHHSYRKGGTLLLLLAFAMYGIVFLTVREDRAYAYPSIVIVGAVLFAAWRAGSALYHLLHFRRQRNPVLLTAKALSLAAALLSLFALQATLLSRFGSSPAQRAVWNGISGTFVGILLTVMAILMIGKRKTSV